MSSQARVREEIAEIGRSMFERGLTGGSSGNISVRLPEGGFLTTPTNVAMGSLDPDDLSRLDESGAHVAGAPPTKEVPLHLAMYARRPDHHAIVHLHSPHATAVSCLAGLDPDDCLPPLTAYFVMRVGRVELVDYVAPGDPSIAVAIEQETTSSALLLANHGPILSRASLRAAADAVEELEQTARILLLTAGRPTRPLTGAQVEALAPPVLRAS